MSTSQYSAEILMPSAYFPSQNSHMSCICRRPALPAPKVAGPCRAVRTYRFCGAEGRPCAGVRWYGGKTSVCRLPVHVTLYTSTSCAADSSETRLAALLTVALRCPTSATATPVHHLRPARCVPSPVSAPSALSARSAPPLSGPVPPLCPRAAAARRVAQQRGISALARATQDDRPRDIPGRAFPGQHVLSRTPLSAAPSRAEPSRADRAAEPSRAGPPGQPGPGATGLATGAAPRGAPVNMWVRARAIAQRGSARRDTVPTGVRGVRCVCM